MPTEETQLWVDVEVESVVKEKASLAVRIDEPFDINDRESIKEAAIRTMRKQATSVAANKELMEPTTLPSLGFRILRVFPDNGGQPDCDHPLFSVENADLTPIIG